MITAADVNVLFCFGKSRHATLDAILSAGHPHIRSSLSIISMRFVKMNIKSLSDANNRSSQEIGGMIYANLNK